MFPLPPSVDKPLFFTISSLSGGPSASRGGSGCRYRGLWKATKTGSHASFRYIGRGSLFSSLGYPEYEVNADMFSASGVGSKCHMYRSLNISPAVSQVWSTGRVSTYASVFTDRLLMERDLTCMTVLPFSLRPLNPRKPKAMNYGTDPKEAVTQLCVLNPTFGWHGHTVMH